MTKTNVMRLLDAAEIPYDPHAYDPHLLEAVAVSNALGERPERVYKTLVCEDEKKNHFVFVVPATSELDLKKAAKTTGSKAINLIEQKDLLPLTGYVHGGCSPIGMKKSFPVYIEQKALELDKMCVSAGRPGFQVELSPKDLAKICKGLFASFAA